MKKFLKKLVAIVLVLACASSLLTACSSKNRFSRVIEACGYKNEILDGVIRISFSTENTMSEAQIAVCKINEVVRNLKGILN